MLPTLHTHLLLNAVITVLLSQSEASLRNRQYQSGHIDHNYNREHCHIHCRDILPLDSLTLFEKCLDLCQIVRKIEQRKSIDGADRLRMFKRRKNDDNSKRIIYETDDDFSDIEGMIDLPVGKRYNI